MLYTGVAVRRASVSLEFVTLSDTDAALYRRIRSTESATRGQWTSCTCLNSYRKIWHKGRRRSNHQTPSCDEVWFCLRKAKLHQVYLLETCID
jgi:hypothetical protein